MKTHAISRYGLLGLLAGGVITATLACAGSGQSPVSPTGVAARGTAVGPSGETLKASPPSPITPDNAAEVSSLRPTLAADNADATYVGGTDLALEFQVLDETGQIVAQSGNVPQGNSTTQYALAQDLVYDSVYRWRARAVLDSPEGEFQGPWSDLASFVTPAAPERPDPGGGPSTGSCTGNWSIGQATGIVLSTVPGPDPFDAGPFRDRVLENLNDPRWGSHMRPNGRISEDVIAWDVPGPRGESYHIFDIVVASTGPDPVAGFSDITDTIEGGSTFVPHCR